MNPARCARLRHAAIAATASLISVLALCVTLVPSSSAAAGQRLRQGRGYSAANGDFVGYYLTANGTKVYCLSPRKALPAGVTMADLARYRGVSPTTSRVLAYALHEWGDARTAWAAAAESQLVNTIVGNTADVARRARHLPASIRSIVRRHLAIARRLHGPYRVTVHTPKSLLPGQSAIGTVVITSAAGHRLAGASVTLTGGANAAVPRKIRTDAHGVGHFVYRVTDVGEVHIHATATELPPTRIRANQPAAGQQHMVSWSHAVNARASASFERRPSGFSHTYACTTACAGRPETTVHACAPASAQASRLGVRYEGKVAYLTFPAARVTGCKDLVLRLADGDHVSAAWQYRAAHGWSKLVVAEGSFTVDCPVVPSVGVTMSYDCTAAAITIGLGRGTAGSWTPSVNTSRRRMVLMVGTKRIYADPGQRAIFTAAVSCDAPVTFTVRAGVRRGNGQYNYGATAVVTTPKR